MQTGQAGTLVLRDSLRLFIGSFCDMCRDRQCETPVSCALAPFGSMATRREPRPPTGRTKPDTPFHAVRPPGASRAAGVQPADQPQIVPPPRPAGKRPGGCRVALPGAVCGLAH